MRTGRPIAPLSLAVEERETLEGWARRPKTAQALAQRSRIVLACAGGSANTAVADKLGVTLPDSRQMAPTVPGAAAGRFARRAAARRPTPSGRRAD